MFRVKPPPTRDVWRAQKKTKQIKKILCAPGPRGPTETEPQ